MFDLLSASPSTSFSGTSILITFERFARFGFILGMSETEMMTMLGPFEVTLFDMLGILTHTIFLNHNN